MKTSARQLAEALYQVIRPKPPAEAKQIINNFARLLSAQGDLNKEQKIIEHLSQIWDRDRGEAAVDIISARALPRESVNALKQYLARLLNRRKINIISALDKSLLGGVVVKYEDQVLDGSLRTRMSRLREGMIK
jgi:F-type H+-transporting ATPase subunit delta